jgi:phosphomannomutase
MSDLIVSVSGIRGIVGESLTPKIASQFARALAAYLGGGLVVVSCDGRPSGVALRQAVVDMLQACGCDVADLGIAPTPTCGIAVRKLNAAGAIQITASHNPAQWNGLKLFGRDGAVLPAEEGQKVADLFRAGVERSSETRSSGKSSDCKVAADWHRDSVLGCVDVAQIRSRALPVLLDANGGAGGHLGRSLLEALGCRGTYIACDADGIFRHVPEPVEDNLREICPLVRRHHAAVGFVLDPDADRLALVDETGRYIGEELTLALALSYRLHQECGPVVVNMSTSRVNEDIARRFGCPFHRSAVGEANVVQKMRAVGAVLGGEGNGGVIDPRVGWVRDPFIGMAMILNLLAEKNKRLSELVAELPSYVIVKDKYAVERERLQDLYRTLLRRWPEATANDVDGLRLDWPDRWLHVRPSNTEPIVRVIAEAPRSEDAQGLCQEVGGLLKAWTNHG